MKMRRQSKKERRQKKRDQIRNKRLIKKYPWLIPRSLVPRSHSWTCKIIKDYDYTWTELDALGEGWTKAFGKMMCEEIQQDLEKHDFVKEFRIMEVKEKYGSARIYTGGVPLESQVHQIIDKYEYISQNVCYCCGRPDTPITNAGWILPLCKECYEKDSYHHRPYDEIIDPEDDCRIPDSYKIIHGVGDSEWIETIDIKDTVEKIRRQWEKRENKRQRARERRLQKISER